MQENVIDGYSQYLKILNLTAKYYVIIQFLRLLKIYVHLSRKEVTLSEESKQ